MIKSLLALLTLASANVIGFDFGSTFFKITLVKPGQPFSIVENTTSMRKTPSMMTIGPENRLWSADSFNNQGRFPATTFADPASYLAQSYSAEWLQELAEQNFIMNDFVQDERGLVGFQTFSLDSKEDNTIYYNEEVVAMILKYGRTLSETQAGSTVRDAVITIPSFYNQEQRRMFLDAAELAGLHVIQLAHENVAAATMFGIDRLDNEKPLNILLYNMGGKNTEVVIAQYSALTDDKGKESEHVEILAETWDEALGGADFDKVIVDMLVEAFNALPERQGKTDVRTDVRAMKRLWKESTKVKDVLSANKVADVKVPELKDYVTLKTLIHRSDFEERSQHLLERVSKPVTEALEKAQMTHSDIDQVEILGGGLRVPRVLELIKHATQKEELSVHLNGDEAMCFGASYMAANSSSQFKVRKVYLTQHPQHEYRINIRPLSEEGLVEHSEISYNKQSTLFRTTDYLGQKKTINLFYDRALVVDVLAASGDDEQLIATYTVEELDKIASSEMAQKEDSTTPKVSLSFELTRSHLLQLNKVEVKIDETVVEEIIPEKTEEPEDSDEDAEKSEETEPEIEKLSDLLEEEAEKQYETKIVPHSFTPEFNEELHGLRLLTAEQKKAARDRIKALEKRDSDKDKGDEAKNTYESLIYEFRGWLQEDENLAYVSGEDQELYMSKCTDGEDWLYEDGANAGYKEYQTRSYELQGAYSKFKNRKFEHRSRTELTGELLLGLSDMHDQLPAILEAKPWISEEEGADVAAKIEDMRSWLDEKLAEQEEVGLLAEPVLTTTEINTRLGKVTKLYKKVTDKKKPKEKKPKVEEEQEQEHGENNEEDL